MKRGLLALAVLATFAAVLLLSGMAVAQSGEGTINTLTVNPRQNQELTNSTGTESGQPSDAVPGSESQPNGLTPVTTNMVGSGSNGNVNQATPGSQPVTPSSNADEGSSAKGETAKEESKPQK